MKYSGYISATKEYAGKSEPGRYDLIHFFPENCALKNPTQMKGDLNGDVQLMTGSKVKDQNGIFIYPGNKWEEKNEQK